MLPHPPPYNGWTETPNAANYSPTPETVRQLVKRIGRPQTWIARQTGISRRRLIYLLKGERVNRNAAGEPYTKAVTLTYPEQFCMEALAASVEAARQLD